jgi:hypothetical protein
VCCSPQEKCGFRSAATLDGRLVSDVCVVQAQSDSRCPEVTCATTKVPGCL